MSYADGWVLVRVSTFFSISSSAVDAFHIKGDYSDSANTQINKSSAISIYLEMRGYNIHLAVCKVTL